MQKKRIVILGAAGRDFHNFNTVYRGDDSCEVVAFTATQIPDIDGRMYPQELCGPGYPDGIPIVPESELEQVMAEKAVDLAVFAYSDVPYGYVMSLASRVNAAGADFALLSATDTQLKSNRPVVSVCAVRTGCGKSQTTRAVARVLQDMGKKVVAIRHPMPYGDLVKQRVQRFACLEDLAKHECTIEEMEEYEPHINTGVVVYAGVDYADILAEAEKEADVILWDGGNNDTSFYKPDVLITLVDPHRPGHEASYYPGETNLRMADCILVNKVDSAEAAGVDAVRASARRLNPGAVLLEAASPISVDDPSLIQGKRVLVVEDGPTLTHGEMKYGAGIVAARKYGAAEVVDPRPWVVDSIAETFQKYPGIGTLLPAMGYGEAQVRDLEKSIRSVDCDTVVIATPIDLGRILKIDKPSVRVRYDLQVIGKPDLSDVLSGI
ncbi:MAG: cyclic 2,3-diphosphoglycerate synthase [Gemmatimonadota bacterium]|jgi:predicted GTPase|nr:GTPase [Gemmatimonadota bacterium]MDP6530098.1 cyclic 2,3-diphosphoglycerate synthase [Gemmatimonadota bacterium]MDP6801974.1 cyclic 2,3-diphosphoglycerate synthase [Gemmatimonadota bacterium]